MNKTKFITILIFMFVIQVLFFIYINEYTYISGDIFESPFLLGFVYLILYFWKKENIKKKYQLTNKYFYLSILITWTILSVISFFVLGLLVRARVLAGTGYFLAGIEYIIMPLFYELEMIVILILDLIWFIIKKILKL